MKKINGKYKFMVDIQFEGLLRLTNVWAKTKNEAKKITKRSYPEGTIKSIKVGEVTANDVRMFIQREAQELKELCDMKDISKEEAFEELVKCTYKIGE